MRLRTQWRATLCLLTSLAIIGAVQVSGISSSDRDGPALAASSTADSAHAQQPPPPTFVCGGEQCNNPRTANPNDSTQYPTPPAWLTSPNAGACVANAVPGMEIVGDFSQVFQMAPDLARTKGFYDPNYWLIQLNSFANSMTFPECRAWQKELLSGGGGGGGGGGGSW
jgi:hypothetical protein